MSVSRDSFTFLGLKQAAPMVDFTMAVWWAHQEFVLQPARQSQKRANTRLRRGPKFRWLWGFWFLATSMVTVCQLASSRRDFQVGANLSFRTQEGPGHGP